MKPTANKYLSSVLSLILFIVFFFPEVSFCQKKYPVTYSLEGKDSLYILQQLNLKTDFSEKENAIKYINALPALLFRKGFAAASVDSVFYDSTRAFVKLYTGEKFSRIQIRTDSVDGNMLNSIGWHATHFQKTFDLISLEFQKERILNYYENSGYPFAEVAIENIEISGDTLSGNLKVKKGILYHFDSIHVYGNVKIKNRFLQHYLNLENRSIFNREKLKEVSKSLAALPFLQEQQPWKLSMLGTGAYLNLYLEEKRSSQVNVLIGFLPGNSITGKSKLTADVHLDLKNALGSGENILLNWQQLQPQSPRLNLGYTQPFIFNSNFGTALSFDLLKRDSNYLQLTSRIGIQYNLSARQNFQLFYEVENSYLLSGGVDTNEIIYSKKLPENIDITSGNVGLSYHFVNTNYIFNPRSGNEFDIYATGGIKKTKRNNDILNLKDPLDPAFNFSSLYDSVKAKTYRFKVVGTAAHYFPFGKNTTLKTAADFGMIQSPQIFRNELFQIGGYKLLRGFDEESIYANQYAVFTAEYRYLTGINSYFFGFSDVGFSKKKYNSFNVSNSFFSAGIGLEFETKFGLLNFSYAVGKRNDLKFDIRNSSKIHFGYINYF
jgi:outer membrane protein assembly factor BamA